MSRHGFDAAVRFGEPALPGVVARRLLETRIVTCAAPAYLERHGRPRHPRELADGHVGILFIDPSTGRPFDWEFHQGVKRLRIDVLRRFGYYSTESNGHLSEYLPWYRKRPEEIGRWIDMSEWIHGETGGYLRYCRETRNWFETEFPAFLERAKRPLDVASRTASK